jgi:hypothetical protein
LHVVDMVARILQVVLWPAAAFGVGVAAFRYIGRALDRRIQADMDLEAAEKRQDLKEREHRLEFEQRTLEAAAELKTAELRLRTAEAEAARELIDDLHEDRLAAQRRILEARTRAEEEQAGEHIRAERELSRAGGKKDIISRYNHYRESYRGSTHPPMSLDKFLEFMRAYGQLD